MFPARSISECPRCGTALNPLDSKFMLCYLDNRLMKKPLIGAIRVAILGVLFLFNISIPRPAGAAGVTVITHGYSGDVNGWITGMADAIPEYCNFPGTNFTIYTITLTTDGAGNYYYQWSRTDGSPLAIDSGEIIVKLDWSQMAGGTGTYDIDTYTVASVAKWVLLQTNSIPILVATPWWNSPFI